MLETGSQRAFLESFPCGLMLAYVAGNATRWFSWYGVGLPSADRLPVVVRIPAGPLRSLKCDPPKGNGRRPQKLLMLLEALAQTSMFEREWHVYVSHRQFD